jgi:hypothetical protein
MVIGSAAMDELGSRLLLGQHTLFFLSAATVLYAASRRHGHTGGLASRTIDAEQTGNPSN